MWKYGLIFSAFSHKMAHFSYDNFTEHAKTQSDVFCVWQ